MFHQYFVLNKNFDCYSAICYLHMVLLIQRFELVIVLIRFSIQKAKNNEGMKFLNQNRWFKKKCIPYTTYFSRYN